MTKIFTKTDLIKRIKKLSQQQIDLGLRFRELALSIESRKDEKKLDEWKEIVKDYLGRLGDKDKAE